MTLLAIGRLSLRLTLVVCSNFALLLLVFGGHDGLEAPCLACFEYRDRGFLGFGVEGGDGFGPVVALLLDLLLAFEVRDEQTGPERVPDAALPVVVEGNLLLLEPLVVACLGLLRNGEDLGW